MAHLIKYLLLKNSVLEINRILDNRRLFLTNAHRNFAVYYISKLIKRVSALELK